MAKYFIALLLSGMFLSTYAQAADKSIGIIVFDGVLTSDVTAPIEVFGMASQQSWFSDYDVKVINVDANKVVTTNEGLMIKVDSHIGQNPKVDVLVVPSSYEMAPLLANKALISYIQRTSISAHWMVSHCSGSQLIAKAGLLDGKQATTWAGGESAFKRDFPKVDVVFDQNFVVDGNVMTSNGGVVTYQASLELLKRIAGESKAHEVAEALQIQRLAQSTLSEAVATQ